MAIIVNNPGYNRLEQKLIELAFNKVQDCHPDNKSRHVSFLVRRNRIDAFGINSQIKTNPLAQRFHYYQNRIHSELQTVVHFFRQGGESLKRHVLYNIRIDRHNRVRMAKPCRFCQKLIVAYNVGSCVFTTDDGTFEELVR